MSGKREPGGLPDADGDRPWKRGVDIAGTHVQKARAGMAVEDRTVALYTAAKGFLIAEWLGALIVLASFTQLYWFTFARPSADPRWTAVAGVVLLALGAALFWRSRTVYFRLEFPWKRRWEQAATVVAGAGGVFWLLFLLLLVLSWAGQPVLPD